jgi:hypothetical protein
MSQPPLPPLPPDVQEMLERTLAAFNSRTKYEGFDLETLRSIKDEHLEQALLDYVFDKLNQNPSGASEVVDSLSSEFQAFYFSWLVEAEVLNGGFNQYFWNSSSEFAEQTPAALEVIGDPKAAEIMREALRIAVAELPGVVKYRSAGTLQAFSESYKHTKLNELDQPFSERAAFFPELRLAYVRAHEGGFVTR